MRDAVQARQQPAFVVAGPLFMDRPDDPELRIETIGAGSIPVPTHFFRVVAMPAGDRDVDAFGVVAPNATEGSLDLGDYAQPIAEIERMSGLTFFPLLDAEVARQIKTEVADVW